MLASAIHVGDVIEFFGATAMVVAVSKKHNENSAFVTLFDNTEIETYVFNDEMRLFLVSRIK